MVGLRLKMHSKISSFVRFTCLQNSLTFFFVGRVYHHTSINAPYKISWTVVWALNTVAVPSVFAHTNTLEAFGIVRTLITIPLIRHGDFGWSTGVWNLCGEGLSLCTRFRRWLFCLRCGFSLSRNIGAIIDTFANVAISVESISTSATVAAQFIDAFGICVANIRIAAFVDVNAYWWRFTFE